MPSTKKSFTIKVKVVNQRVA